MTLTVVTGWSPEGWELYGRRFLESFDRFWPLDVALIVYGEAAVSPLMLEALFDRKTMKARTTRQITFIPLDHIEGCTEFLERHRDNLYARGKDRLPQHHWKERAVLAGYNWRFDAWKFCRQGFIPEHAARRCGTDFLCWLDGDVVTTAPLASSRTITDLMPPGKWIAYLGREPKHPDIAFQLYDLRLQGNPETHTGADHAVDRMLCYFAEIYRTDEVFQLPEWHSAYVWKVAIERAGARPVLHNLTPTGSGHVWHQSPLRLWGDHLKGDRKKRGRSLEAPAR